MNLRRGIKNISHTIRRWWSLLRYIIREAFLPVSYSRPKRWLHTRRMGAFSILLILILLVVSVLYTVYVVGIEAYEFAADGVFRLRNR